MEIIILRKIIFEFVVQNISIIIIVIEVSYLFYT